MLSLVGEVLRIFLSGYSPVFSSRFSTILGNFSATSDENQIEIIFGSYSSSSAAEIYLFEDNSEEAIWGSELVGENATVYQMNQECNDGCSIKLIGKALHTQGEETITLKLEVRSSLEEGQMLISTLY